MLTEDQILEFIKLTGPTLPTKVAKTINQQILFASAHLSDLVARGKLRISKLKVGGSPLYYLSGQEDRLYDFASGNVNPKDLEVLDRLKKEKLLREKDLELLPRVALRALKDFAFPIEVNYNGQKDLFWKWHLLKDEELNLLLKDFFESLEKEAKIVEDHLLEERRLAEQEITSQRSQPAEQEDPKDVVQENNQDRPYHQHSKDNTTVERKKTTMEKDLLPKEKETTAPSENKQLVLSKSLLPKTSETSSEEKRQRQKSKNDHSLRKEEKESEKYSGKYSVNHREKEQLSLLSEEKELEHHQQRELLSGSLKEAKKEKKSIDDPFLPPLSHFLSQIGITIETHEVIRKNAEINLLLKVPSAVGITTYFCKAKNKKKCDEKDLSTAYMEAQIKKLPLLLLYTGDFTKKAQEMLETGTFENVIVRKIE